MNATKKIVTALVIASLFGGSLVPLSPASAEPGPALLGDVNGDGKVSMADAVVIHKHLASSGTLLNGFMQSFADVNGDGQITAADARLIQSYYLGKTETFAFTHFGLTPSNQATDTGNAYIIDFTVLVSPQADKHIRVLDADGLVDSFPATDPKVQITGTRVTLTLDGLAAETEYRIVIDEGAFVDPQGNRYAGISVSNPWTFATAAAAGSTTLYVSPSAANGNGTEERPFGSIHEALDAAGENDTIYLKPGTYYVSQAVNINKAGVKLQGATHELGFSLVSIMLSSDIAMAADGTALESIMVSGMLIQPKPLVLVEGDNVEITNSIFGGPLQQGPKSLWEANSGITIAANARNVLIEGNGMVYLRHGVQAFAGTTGELNNNLIYNTDTGIYIDGSAMTLTGNSWGSSDDLNTYDITLGQSTTSGPPYDSIDALRNANNGANVSDQRQSVTGLRIQHPPQLSGVTGKTGALLRAAADDRHHDAAVRVPDVQGGAGQTVRAPIAVDTPLQALTAFGLEIAYPSDIMDVVGIEGAMTAITAEDWHLSASQGTLRVAWIDESLSTPIRQAGTLFNVVFRIKPDAESGSRPLTIAADDSLQLVNADAEKLHAQVLKQGTVTVTSPNQPHNPYPGSGSSSGSGEQVRTVDVKLGGDQGEAVASVPVKRTVSPTGAPVDSVLLDSGKAEQLVGLVGKNGQHHVRVIVTDLPGSPADEQRIDIPAASVHALAEGDIQLTIQLPDVEISLSKESLHLMQADGKDLYFRVVPIRDEEQRNEAAKNTLQAEAVLAAANGGSVILLGKPMTIETNYTGFKTKLLFPLSGLELPDNLAEAERRLTGIAVYIEHSDGEKKLQRGIVQFDENGRPAGIEIEVEKFSTFSVIHAEKLEATEYAAYMNGYPDGTFRPDAELTRAELAAILNRTVTVIGEVMHGDAEYIDVPPHHWAYTAIASVRSMGLMLGDGSSFRPEAYVTRAELAAVTARMLSLPLTPSQGNGPVFPDMEGHWASSYIAAAKQSGLLDGYEDGTFRPDRAVTRAEAAALFNRAWSRPSVDEEHPAWEDVSPDHWAYSAIDSATRSFLAD